MVGSTGALETGATPGVTPVVILGGGTDEADEDAILLLLGTDDKLLAAVDTVVLFEIPLDEGVESGTMGTLKSRSLLTLCTGLGIDELDSSLTVVTWNRPFFIAFFVF